MKLNLVCPKCGFAFGVMCPDTVPDDELKEIMTCPCGEMMVKTGALYGNVWKGDADGADS